MHESVSNERDQRFTRVKDRLEHIVGDVPKDIGLTNNSTCIYLDVSTFEAMLPWAEIDKPSSKWMKKPHRAPTTLRRGVGGSFSHVLTPRNARGEGFSPPPSLLPSGTDVASKR
jgi:hypothetical protein